jgi:hypothetical protein
VLNELKSRGVEDVLIVVCDGLIGLPEAINTVWPQATVQTCLVHLVRASLRWVNYKDRQAKNIATSLRAAVDQQNSIAASLVAAADVLNPPATPAPAPTPTYPNFQPIFEEQFTTSCAEGEFLSKYGTKWSAYPTAWRDTSKKGQYNPGIISVTNGIMTMRLHTNSAGVPQVCAPEPKINGATADKAQLYGRYEVRFRADAVDGYKTAWLLCPRSEVWPRDGEIDFVEGDLLGTIGAFMNRQNGTSGGDQDEFRSTARYPDWHTVALEWTPNRLQVFLDGVALRTTTGADRVTSRIPNTPMRTVLQTETELNGTYPPRTAVARVQVDYFKAWKYVP